MPRPQTATYSTPLLFAHFTTVLVTNLLYIKRLADEACCVEEPNAYFRHLTWLREVFPAYPCHGIHQRRGSVAGHVYLASRPASAVRVFLRLAWNGVEEYYVGWLFIGNLACGFLALVFPWLRRHPWFARLSIETPAFSYFIVPLLALLMPGRRGCPSVLAHPIPHRGVHLLAFGLYGAKFYVVAAMVAVALVSTFATMALLQREGLPLYYEPVRLTVHLVIASVVALTWTALRDGLLPRFLLARRSAKQVCPKDSAVVASSKSGTCLEGFMDGGGGSGLAGSGSGETASPGPPSWGVSRGKFGSSALFGLALGGGDDSRRAAGKAVCQGDGAPVEFRPPQELQLAHLLQGLKCRFPTPPLLHPEQGQHKHQHHQTQQKEHQQPQRLQPGARSTTIDTMSVEQCRAVPAADDIVGSAFTCRGCQYLPPAKLLPSAGSPGRVLVLEEDSAASLAQLLPRRRRFASQLHRDVLRIRITGADPEQLPPDWQEIVFAHFSSGRQCGYGPPADHLASPYLVTGVAVRRGSIYMTVSMVQLPNPHDGGEGGGAAPVGPRAGAGGDAAVAAGNAQEVPPRGDRGAEVQQPWAAVEAGEAEAPAGGGGGGAGGPHFAPQQLQQPQQPDSATRGLGPKTGSMLASRETRRPPVSSASQGYGGSLTSDYLVSGGTLAGAVASAMTAPGFPLAPGSLDAATTGMPTGMPPGTGSGGSWQPGQRRRIAGVWRAERLGTFQSASPSSTPGNSNNPLPFLGLTAATASINSGMQHSPGAMGYLLGPGPFAGPGGGPSGGSRSMRYTPTLSPAQQASLCGTGGALLGMPPTVGGGGGSSLEHHPYLYHYSPPQYQSQYYQLHPSALRSGSGAPGPLYTGSVSGVPRTGGASSGSPAAFQVAQLLDAMQLRSRGGEIHGSTGATASSTAATNTAAVAAAATSREARHGCAMTVLSAVSQLDGGIPQHLRHVLATEGWEVDDGFSSSWETEGVYERPLPPLPVLIHAPGMGSSSQVSPAAAGGQAAALRGPRGPGVAPHGTPLMGGGPLRSPQMLVMGPSGSTEPWGPPGVGMRPSHTAGLAVLADPASLPVRDVAVKPVLICKAPLARAAEAGGLAASVPPAPPMVPSGGTAAAGGTAATTAAAATNGPSGASGATAAAVNAATATAAPGADDAAGRLSELHLSLLCAPATVSELSVMLRYCGPASVFGEQTYLPVQLQLDSSSPAVAAAIRLQAAAADRDRRGGGDTQAARDVAEGGEAATDVRPARATVRTALAELACPGVLYVELWHGPQLCACLPVLLLPESAAAWAHEVCSLWQQQAEEGEAAAAAAAASDGSSGNISGGGASSGGLSQGRVGAAAVSAAAHQVAEDLGGWLTYAAHKRFVAERAAVPGAAAAIAGNIPAGGNRLPRSALAAASGGLPSGAGLSPHAAIGLAARSGVSGASARQTSVFPPHVIQQDEGYPGWSWESGEGLIPPLSPGYGFTALHGSPPMPGAATAMPRASGIGDSPPSGLSPSPSMSYAGASPAASAAAASAVYGTGHLGDPAGTAAAAAAAAGAMYCNRELFHDMMLQEGYNWLADCVEAGCCGLATALMESLLSAGCSAAEVMRTCRSADGLPLMHAATLSGNPAMMELVWHWGHATGLDMRGWAPPPGLQQGVGGGYGASYSELDYEDEGEDEVDYMYAAVAGGTPVGAVSSTTTGRVLPAAASTSEYDPQDRTGALSGQQPQAAGATMGARAAVSSPLAVAAATATPSGAAGSLPRAASSGGGDVPPSLTIGARLEAASARFRSSARRIIRRALSPMSRLAAMVPQPLTAFGASPQRVVQVAGQAGRQVGARTSAICARGAAAVRQVAGGFAAWCRSAVGLFGGWMLQLGVEAITGTHAGLLRLNVLHEDGGAEEQQFLRHFQLRHGWVFSAWCWSMIPLYVLILARYIHEREWGKLALTPLWMWMYVVCAAADVFGATAAYRRRTEALAAAMHLSHSLAKALACTGLPSYPMPPGRLYWTDVLACATLSALCEPVRICVACPLRLVNFAVSTVLYRLTGTAPTYLEAMLLSASCHCFGLLLQHAVESQYRRGFNTASAATAAATVGAPVTTGDGVLAHPVAATAASAAAAAAGGTSTKAQAELLPQALPCSADMDACMDDEEAFVSTESPGLVLGGGAADCKGVVAGGGGCAAGLQDEAEGEATAQHLPLLTLRSDGNASANADGSCAGDSRAIYYELCSTSPAAAAASGNRDMLAVAPPRAAGKDAEPLQTPSGAPNGGRGSGGSRGAVDGGPGRMPAEAAALAAAGLAVGAAPTGSKVAAGSQAGGMGNTGDRGCSRPSSAEATTLASAVGLCEGAGDPDVPDPLFLDKGADRMFLLGSMDALWQVRSQEQNGTDAVEEVVEETQPAPLAPAGARATSGLVWAWQDCEPPSAQAHGRNMGNAATQAMPAQTVPALAAARGLPAVHPVGPSIVAGGVGSGGVPVVDSVAPPSLGRRLVHPAPSQQQQHQASSSAQSASLREQELLQPQPWTRSVAETPTLPRPQRPPQQQPSCVEAEITELPTANGSAVFHTSPPGPGLGGPELAAPQDSYTPHLRLLATPQTSPRPPLALTTSPNSAVALTADCSNRAAASAAAFMVAAGDTESSHGRSPGCLSGPPAPSFMVAASETSSGGRSPGCFSGPPAPSFMVAASETGSSNCRLPGFLSRTPLPPPPMVAVAAAAAIASCPSPGTVAGAGTGASANREVHLRAASSTTDTTYGAASCATAATGATIATTATGITVGTTIGTISSINTAVTSTATRTALDSVTGVSAAPTDADPNSSHEAAAARRKLAGPSPGGRISAVHGAGCSAAVHDTGASGAANSGRSSPASGTSSCVSGGGSGGNRVVSDGSAGGPPGGRSRGSLATRVGHWVASTLRRRSSRAGSGSKSGSGHTSVRKGSRGG